MSDAFSSGETAAYEDRAAGKRKSPFELHGCAEDFRAGYVFEMANNLAGYLPGNAFSNHLANFALDYNVSPATLKPNLTDEAYSGFIEEYNEVKEDR